VFVRRDPKTGDVILSRKSDSWDGLFKLYSRDQVPNDSMDTADRTHVTRTYGDLRAACEARDLTLAPLDMMIAAHAVAADAALVTRDRAFARVLKSLKIDD